MGNVRDRKRSGDPVLLKIDAIRRSAAYWTLGWGFLCVAVIIAATIFCGILLDHAFVLQKWGRLAFFRFFVFLSCAAALAAALFPFVRRIGRLYVARRMEVHRPQLRNTLISYLQCRDDPGMPRELKGLMRRKAARLIRPLDTGIVVDASRYVRLAGLLCVVLVVSLAYAAVSPKSAALSVRRLLAPRADILPPTSTRLIEIEPGEMYLVSGDEPRLKVRVEGVMPRSVYAVWDGVSFQDRRILLTPKEVESWEGRFPAVLEDGGYYVVAGDTRSERFGITVLPKPVVTRLQLTIRPPAYTGSPVRTVSDGNLDVLSGTTVDVAVATNLPPGRGRLKFDSGQSILLRPVKGRSELRGRFTALRSDAYSVHFETVPYPTGAVFENPAPVRYTLTCRGDQAPTVTLLAPPDGLELRPSDKAEIIYSARDDFKVAAIRLRYRVNNLVGPTVLVAEPDAMRVDGGAYTWDMSTAAVRPGKVITYYLEAEDNRPDVPQVGRSEARRITIVGPTVKPEEQDGLALPEEPPKPEQVPPSESAGPVPPGERARSGLERQAAAPAAEQGPSRAAELQESDRDETRRRLAEFARKLAEAMQEEEQPEARGDSQPAEPGEEAAPVAAGPRDKSAKPREAGARDGQSAPPAEPCPACSGSGRGKQGRPCAACSGTGAAGRSAGRTAGQGGGQAGGGQGAAAGGQGRTGPGGQDMSQSPDGATPRASRAGRRAPVPGAGDQRVGADQGRAASADASDRRQSGGGAGGTEGRGVTRLPAPGAPEGPFAWKDLDRVVEELARMLEDDSVPPRFLDELETDREELRRFVRQYREERRAAEREAARQPDASDAADEPGRVLGIQGPADEGMAAKDASPTESPKDALRSRFEGAADRLSPRYRAVVERYYKVLSEEQ